MRALPELPQWGTFALLGDVEVCSSLRGWNERRQRVQSVRRGCPEEAAVL
jgi:hypothetical protein